MKTIEYSRATDALKECRSLKGDLKERRKELKRIKRETGRGSLKKLKRKDKRYQKLRKELMGGYQSLYSAVYGLFLADAMGDSNNYSMDLRPGAVNRVKVPGVDDD